jgi:hypothetical protein
MATPVPASFAELLDRAITEPGVISTAYRKFHNYSLGNVLLAWSQCLERGIAPGPLATFQRWKELGRYVRKGEKAITLCRGDAVLRCARPEGVEYSRGYIPNCWGKGNPIPERSAQRVLRVTDQILRAGRADAMEARS